MRKMGKKVTLSVDLNSWTLGCPVIPEQSSFSTKTGKVRDYKKPPKKWSPMPYTVNGSLEDWELRRAKVFGKTMKKRVG